MQMKDKWKDSTTDILCDAILSLQSREECYQLFEDLCTVSEIKSLAQRLHIASLLSKGYTYSDISVATGVSTATISRVNRCLEYGADGYKSVLSKIDDNKNNTNIKGDK
jgi:TrpR-related protein YerC/YecD